MSLFDTFRPCFKLVAEAVLTRGASMRVPLRLSANPSAVVRGAATQLRFDRRFPKAGPEGDCMAEMKSGLGGLLQFKQTSQLIPHFLQVLGL